MTGLLSTAPVRRVGLRADPGSMVRQIALGLPRELDVEGLLSEAATLLKVAELEDGRRARSTPNAPRY